VSFPRTQRRATATLLLNDAIKDKFSADIFRTRGVLQMRTVCTFSDKGGASDANRLHFLVQKTYDVSAWMRGEEIEPVRTRREGVNFVRTYFMNGPIAVLQPSQAGSRQYR